MVKIQGDKYMISKLQISEYRKTLSLMEASGKTLFFKTKCSNLMFESATEAFINMYEQFFPSECRILRTYALKILTNKTFSSEDMNLIQYMVNIIDEDFEKKVKPPKVFISHCEKDIGLVEKFADLLSHIGISTNQLFCSSVPGYNIKQGSGNIYDYLREEFNNNLFVIFMLSSNYYKSVPCLNEMGATWVLKKKYQSILLPGFEYSQIKGAIDPCDISFKLDDKKYRTSALGELKDNIVQFLELDNVDVSKWDYQSERFFSMIDEATTN